MSRDNVSFASRPQACPAQVLLLGLALAAAAPAAAQPTGLACVACVHEEIKHHWRIPDHPRFSQDTVLQFQCADIEFPAPEFRVVADGAQVSEFEIDRVVNAGSPCDDKFKNPQVFFLDENREKVSSPDPKKYGSIFVTAQDAHGLYFKYTHPTDPPPEGHASRDVTIGFEYERTVGGRVMWDTMVIHVYRPPVVMTHGLWADSSSFTKMEANFSGASHNYPKELLLRVNYSGSHDASFADNIDVVGTAVAALIEQATHEDYAVGRVDLVGHSMGGILSRLYVQGQHYGDDVRRIVTCNTPHAGAQMANWLLDEVWDPAGIVCGVLGQAVGSCYNGAVCDLNVYSYGIHNLLNKPFAHPGDVQVHALSTISDATAGIPAGPTLGFISTNYLALIQSAIPFCDVPAMIDEIFKGDENDAVVPLASQSGGLEGAKTSLYEDQVHVGSTANPAVIERVRKLLSEPKSSSSFTESGYAPPSLYYNSPTSCSLPHLSPAPGGPAPQLSAGAAAVAPTPPFCPGGRSACCATANHAPHSLHALAASTLAISSPAPGASLSAGQAFTATVVGSADVATIVLLLTHHGDEIFLARQAGPVATFDLHVPLELAGAKVLVAFALDAGGRPVATSNSVNLNITVAATLQALSVYPPALHLDPAKTGALEVTGSYSDGIDRDLSQVPGLAFAFAEGHASRTGTNGVTLNELLDDAVTVSYQGISAPEVAIRALPPAQPRVPKGTVRRHFRRT